MRGYWVILGTEITDHVAQAEHSRLWAPIAEKYHARLNPTTVPPLLKEARNTARVIIAEFPTYELATAYYDDPAYQEARAFALKASKRDLLIIKRDFA